VLRFTAQLGFSSYRTFQEALIREVHEEMGSPLRQIAAAEDSPEKPAGTSSPAQHYAEVLASSFDALPETELARATAVLSDPRMRLHLLGGRFSQVLADYLTFHLVLVRSSVRGVPTAELERTTMLLELGQRDVLVLFDYRRYDQDLLVFARDAAARGAHIVLFTDPWMSPIAAVADIVLPARVEAPSPFDSLVPAMAVVESVVAAVTERLGEAARSRLSAIESLSRHAADE
jgi:DNA-binding MurR/RpiR family transcriptional regulator